MSIPVEEAIARSGLLSPGDHVLAAVSGGADSTAMLCALHAGAPRLGIRLSAAHFDHRLRPESKRDAEAVAALCTRLGIELFGGADDVRARADERGESIESAARRCRYAFLEETRARIGATRIATAHTRDDQVETVLMRVLRGAGIRGLSGIPRERGAIVRPLLDVTRADTVAYCEDSGVTWIEDASNADVTHTRNRLRHETIPELRAGGEDVAGDLLRIAAKAERAVTRVRAQTRPLVESAVREESDGVWVVNVAPLAQLDAIARYVFFADLFAERMRVECDAGRAHFSALDALCDSGAGSGRMVSLPGMSARREHDEIVFYLGARHPGEIAGPLEETVLEVPGHTSIGGADIDVSIIRGDDAPPLETVSNSAVESVGGRTRRVAYFAMESLRLPLVARSPRRGERMRPFGMTGRKKLSDIFVDRKVPARERERSLVVTDSEEVVWLVGVATSEKTRIEAGTTPLVRITVTS